MRRTAVAFALALLLGAAPHAAAAPPPWEPTWADEFDGAELDRGRWTPQAGPRRGGVLTPDAVSVADGRLTIRTWTQAAQHLSGIVVSHAPLGGFEQTYGYFEARIRFASRPGQWSAFWVSSSTIGRPVGDPATAGVEMDVVEHRARCVEAPSPSPPEVCSPRFDISDRSQHALIWDGYGAESRSSVRLTDPLPGLAEGGWHRWAMAWTPTEVTFFYDDLPVFTSAAAISRRPQYLLLSSEVDDTFAGPIPPGGYGSFATTDARMEVDYVRVWRHVG